MATHKTLKSVVRNMAESFTSLMNYQGDDYVMGHVVFAAWQTGATEFRLDLLTGATDSSLLLVPHVRDSVANYVKWLPEMVQQSNSDPHFVSQAELLVTVDPHTRRPHGHSGFFESPFTCTVRIVDDRGKEYSHRISDWWYPERVLPKGSTVKADEVA
jgi:hypothetical protein